MMGAVAVLTVVVGGLVAVLGTFLLFLVWELVIKQYLTYRRLTKQGIRGPPFRPLVGHLPEIRRAQALPEVCSIEWEWRKLYGGICVFGQGPTPRLSITDPNLIRQIFVANNESYGKTKLFKRAFPILGTGLIFADGEMWARQRKLMNPTFGAKQIKKAIPVMMDSVASLTDKWDALLAEGGGGGGVQVEVHKEVLCLSLDIIRSAALGGRAEDSRDMAHAFTRYMDATLNPKHKALHLVLPGYRHLPTADNLERLSWQQRLLDMLQATISARGAEASSDDLLGTLMAADMDKAQLINECFTFLVGGHETTAQLLGWSMVLLASHPEWQDRVRAEVRQVWPHSDLEPHQGALAGLKDLGLFIAEALRLFPPVFQMVRRCLRPNRLGPYHIPAGVELQVPLYVLHTDPNLWGPDATTFRPDRFRDGVAQACSHSMGYIPFGVGPRICIGQGFALAEAKVALATLVNKYAWTLAPGYRKEYAYAVTLRPGGPVPIVLRRAP